MALGVALVLMGLGLIVLGLMGRRAGGFVAASLVLALFAVPAVALADAAHKSGGRLTAGDYSYTPTTQSQAERGFGVSMGQIRVDLTKVPLKDGQTVYVTVGVGMGRATVVVPKDEAVVVNALVSAGEIDTEELPGGWEVAMGANNDHIKFRNELSDEGISGIDVEAKATSPAAQAASPRLEVQLKGSMGQLEIEEGNK
jgi:hypothetical protein